MFVALIQEKKNMNWVKELSVPSKIIRPLEENEGTLSL